MTPPFDRWLPRVLGAALLMCGLLTGGPAFAQETGDEETTAPSESDSAEASSETDASEADDSESNTDEGGDAPDTYTVPVNVEHGESGEPLADKGVVLRASRPKGPFESEEPEPRHEFTGVTNSDGTALFSEVPVDIVDSDLELYAVASHGNVSFKSRRVDPTKGTHLTVEVFEKAQSLDDFRVQRLRTIVQIWEKSLWITQHWYLTVDGQRPVDVSLLSDPAYEKGIPLKLPLKAKSISAKGPGSTEVVDSTVHWTGLLKPNQPKILRVRFRMTAETPTFEYRQQVEYPIDSVDVTAFLGLNPDRARFERVDDLELAAPGFEDVEYTPRPPQLPPGEALHASGQALEAGESFAFKLYGLPFDNPIAPWIFVGLGALGIGFVLFIGLRNPAPTDTDEGRRQSLEMLREERADLLDELAALEAAFEDGDVEEIDYETESLRLRERIALITRKIDELSDADDSASSW